MCLLLLRACWCASRQVSRLYEEPEAGGLLPMCLEALIILCNPDVAMEHALPLATRLQVKSSPAGPCPPIYLPT